MLVKLGAAVQTDTDFEELALRFGIEINVISGRDYAGFPFVFPIIFLGSEEESRFTIVVEILNQPSIETFPFIFPITFAADAVDQMRCFFNKLKPANVQILFIEK